MVQRTVDHFGQMTSWSTTTSSSTRMRTMSLSRRSIVELPIELFDGYLNVNLRGTFLTIAGRSAGS